MNSERYFKIVQDFTVLYKAMLSKHFPKYTIKLIIYHKVTRSIYIDQIPHENDWLCPVNHNWASISLVNMTTEDK